MEETPLEQEKKVVKGKAKSTAIHEQLAETLRYICEREGFSTDTFEKKDTGNLFPRNVIDITEMRETIGFLKDYAKIQTVAKLLSDSESLRADIASAKASFSELILEAEKTLGDAQQMSTQYPKRKVSLMYNYGEEFRGTAAKGTAEAKKRKADKIRTIKSQIKTYKSKIRELESLERIISNPKKVIERFFPEEDSKLQEGYGRLVSLCARSMREVTFERDLFGEDGIFEKDGQGYKLNETKARRFISVLKSKNAIKTGAAYAKANQKYLDKKSKYDDISEKIKNYDFVLKVSDSEEFKKLIEKVNGISEMYEKLYDAEERAMRGNFFTRTGNIIKQMLGMVPITKVPKKVLKMREEVASRIDELLSNSQENDKTKDALRAYSILRNGTPVYNRHDPTGLKTISHELRMNGIERLGFCFGKIDPEEVKLTATMWKSRFERGIVTAEQEMESARAESELLYSKLSKKAKRILETEGERAVIDYENKYYRTHDAKAKRPAEYDREASAGTAAIILESILKKKNISWNDFFRIYGDVLGSHTSREIEENNLSRLLTAKVQKLSSGITGMVTEGRETLEEIRRDIPITERTPDDIR